MKKFHILLLFILITTSCTESKRPGKLTGELELSKEAYEEAVYASWLGQLVGNTYGLCYEFKYIDEPGPDTFPYCYTWTLDSLRHYNGAFSDDDTDIEYMYLTQMEKHGSEPSYAQLSEAWKNHVTTRVWCANRQAVALMHAGHFPPATGSVRFNPQWCQIDPQLVNEIWAITAPGMMQYAVDKSAFAARITNDSFGIEPTLHYAAMYSAAFFEKDIPTIIDIGTRALPARSRFSGIVEEVKELYRMYPNDWKTSRKIIKEKYYTYADYNKNCWPVIDAQLNGAFGIMALLYGEGDFRKTLDYCCALGMDADNQAATMCGLVALIKGKKCIPHELLFPLKNSGWTKPYNNSYRMITRPGLSDDSITGLAMRTARMGEKNILKQGGKIEMRDGKAYYRIPSHASFVAPFELNPIPNLSLEIHETFSYPLYAGAVADSLRWSLEGNVPSGFRIENKALVATPVKTGNFSFHLVVRYNNESKKILIEGMTHSRNLSKEASSIVFNTEATDHNVECIRDGKKDFTYYSTKSGAQRMLDFYGYTWDSEQTISSLQYSIGAPREYCGWFTSLSVEYLKNDQWVPVKQVRMSPEMNLENNQWLKPTMIDYSISFEKVRCRGIRIIGLSGGIPKDATNAHLGLQYYTSISELKVFEE
ncbi:MAG: ADP-ribosylglycohydrolase family protein [Cytophagaceae bacterium]|jgi:hypothetical protein|nr:ADP-ribosylglycohydrolase family protein [Cytophagaceae bacterium]